jgi:hypothetical protein
VIDGPGITHILRVNEGGDQTSCRLRFGIEPELREWKREHAAKDFTVIPIIFLSG